MKRKLLYLASLMLVFSGLLGLLQTQTASATYYPNIKICHMNRNHYNAQTVDGSSILNSQGHNSHSGDIIPAFWYSRFNDNDVRFTQPQPHEEWWYLKYNGKNLGAIGIVTGQAILNNNCVTPKVDVTPATPTFVDPTCENASAYYTIPAKTGVQYKVNGVKKSQGTYMVDIGSSVTITAVALEGYTLQGTASWMHTFNAQGLV